MLPAACRAGARAALGHSALDRLLLSCICLVLLAACTGDEPDLFVEPGAPEVMSFGAEPDPVNPGVATVLRWQVERGDVVELSGPGIAGSPVEVTGSSTYTVSPTAGADYTLFVSNSAGSAEAQLEDVGRAVPAASFVVAGQSNAVGLNVEPSEAMEMIEALPDVHMLGNDYVWKPAYEPLDDCIDQVDVVSLDPTAGCVDMGIAGVSLGVSLGNEVSAATGGMAFLIPAAKGGTDVRAWQPAADRFDRYTLFGSAAHRARVARLERGAPLGDVADGPAYGSIVWYQGESDTSDTAEADEYQARTDVVFDAFQEELASPIIFVQLARIYERTEGELDETGRNLIMQIVREAQRDLESPTARRFLVVAHDLPMVDRIHLSAAGEIELGRRVALAYRERILGEPGIDGTGPRLLRVEQRDDTTVVVHFDRAISAPTTTGPDAYSSYFAVFSGTDAPLGMAAIARGDGDEGADTAVVITLSEPHAGSVQVRYLPPTLASDQGEPMLADVVRSATCAEPMPGADVCLPAPAFGTATDMSLESLQFLDLESW